METDYRERLMGAGERAENSIAWYCDLKQYSMVVPDKDTKRDKGIDVFINERATDVKETRKILLGNYRGPTHPKENIQNKFLARMPFCKNCGAVDYLLTEIDPIGLSIKIVYHGPILQYLLDNYFLGEAEMLAGYQLLFDFQFKTPQRLGLNNGDELLQLLKDKMKVLVKPNILIDYTDSSILDHLPDTNEFQIYMIKKEDVSSLIIKRKYYKEDSKKGG